MYSLRKGAVGGAYGPFHMGVASRLATIYVAMVTPILYDNSYSLKVATHHRTQYLNAKL